MKKKILTLVMALAVTMTCTSPAFASTSKKCMFNLSDFYAFLSNCINISIQQKPEQQPEEETPEHRPEQEVPEQKPEQQKPQQDNTATDSTKAGQILSLVNKERSNAGLSSLRADSQLNKLAQMKAEDMAKNRYFSHTSPTYGSAFDMMNQYGVSYRTAGENIAKGQKTAQSVMTGWMNSPGHRANILKSGYTRLGVGYALDAGGTPYWVQIFAG